MPSLRVLIVDDEKPSRETMAGGLKKQGYQVTEADSADAAIAVAEKTFFEIALLDIKMPGRSGLELLPDLLRSNPDLQAIMVSALWTFESAMEAMKKGAFDFLKKPLDLEELLATLERAGERHWLLAENRYLKEKLEEPYRDENIIMASAAMREVFSTVARAADSDASVLVRGESGTGKEVVARALHRASSRSARSFIAVNCAAIPETLLEAELFGSEKGAYTGAIARRIGRFELASGGTLFLDEIGDMPPSIQAKLLRILEQKTFERLGGTETIHTDCRVVTATHQDLEEMVKESKFREDLYYRLNVIQIVIPPLRERSEDILPLIDTFITRFNHGRTRPITGITPAVKDALLSYSWPGNVRELLNAIERACVLVRGDVLDLADFPPRIGQKDEAAESITDGGESPSLPLAEVERRHIIRTLQHHNWALAQTAASLGIHRNTLRLKMNEYGIRKG
ncbi:MAG TPA: sigma-54 dependent transcriptional regulator [Acidobacteriota bacterium]|nr:sigma-54 dependent transcriptional regulator [Acidobacteriota bacterium]